jgi:WD40 repeat protein
MRVSRRRAIGLFGVITLYLLGATLLWHWLGPAPRYVLPEGRHGHGYSDDGRYLLTAAGSYEQTGPGSVSEVRAGPVELWDLRTGSLVTSVIEPGAPIGFALVSPDSRRLAVREGALGKPGRLKLFKLPSGEADGAIDVLPYVQGMHIRFAPDSRTLAVDTGKRAQPQVTLLDIDGERPAVVIDGVRASFAFSPDGQILAATGSIQDRGKETAADVRLFDAATGRLLATLPHECGPATSVIQLHFSPTGTFLVAELYLTKSRQFKLCAWDVEQRRTVLERDELTTTAFLQDGKSLVASGHVGPTWQAFVVIDLVERTERTIPTHPHAWHPNYLQNAPHPPLLVSTWREELYLAQSLHEWASAVGLAGVTRQTIRNTSEIRSAHTGKVLATYGTTGNTHVFLTPDPSAVLISSAPYTGSPERLELWDMPPPATFGRQAAAAAGLAVPFACGLWLLARRRRALKPTGI